MTKRILIIGTGSIGERHLRCFQTLPGVEVAACEPNPALAAAVAERYHCPVYASLDEALACDAPFYAAVICTPAHTHLPIALRCIRAGHHLFIEKPLSVSEQGIEELRCAEAETGLTVRVAYVNRSNATLLKLHEIIASVQLGTPKQVSYVGGQNFPTFRPAYRDIYYASHASGGGAIQDALTHSLNSMEWLAVAPITSLFTHAAHQVLEGVEVEDTVNLTARLANGALATFTLNQFQHPNEATFALHYEGGSVKAEIHASRVGLFRKGDTDWTWHTAPVEERDGPFLRQAAAFLAATAGTKTPLSTLDEAIQTLRVNLAALESVRTRQEIAL